MDKKMARKVFTLSEFSMKGHQRHSISGLCSVWDVPTLHGRVTEILAGKRPGRRYVGGAQCASGERAGGALQTALISDVRMRSSPGPDQ